MHDEKETKIEIEQMIDALGMFRVLGLLSEICYEKAEHIRSNWQDSNMARSWDRAGEYLDRVRITKRITEVG